MQIKTQVKLFWVQPGCQGPGIGLDLQSAHCRGEALTLLRGFTPGAANTSSLSKFSQAGVDFRILFFCCSASSSFLSLSGTSGGVPGGVSGWDPGVRVSSQCRVSGWRPLTKYSVSPTPREPSNPGLNSWVPAVEGLMPSCRERRRWDWFHPHCNLLQSNTQGQDLPFSTYQSNP